MSRIRVARGRSCRLDDENSRAKVQNVRADSWVGKVGKAEQIAEAAVWLISPNADVVHGATLIADGGILMH